MMKKDRLFVPLCTQPFLDFKENGKQYEIRACSKNYSEKFVYEGRAVELRKGYSGDSIHGTIGKVITGTLEDILTRIDYKLIVPKTNSVQEAVQDIKDMLGQKPKYIAFEVLF